jgi:hypothetical protein
MSDRFKEDVAKVETTERQIRAWLKEREQAIRNNESTGRVTSSVSLYLYIYSLSTC